MLSREHVEVVLERIRPIMRADGGDIELINVGERSVGVRLTGRCADCPRQDRGGFHAKRGD